MQFVDKEQAEESRVEDEEGQKQARKDIREYRPILISLVSKLAPHGDCRIAEQWPEDKIIARLSLDSI